MTTPARVSAVQAALRPTFVDRALASVAPTFALRRIEARARFAFASGGYDAAGGDEDGFRKLRSPRGDADTLSASPLPLIRARTQQVARNNPIAIGAKRTHQISVVGGGILCEPQLDAAYLIEAGYLPNTPHAAKQWEATAQRLWNLVTNDVRFDAQGVCDYVGQQNLVAGALFDAGDILMVRRWKPTHGRVAATCVELIEAARIGNVQDQPDTATTVNGVELDVPGGEPVAYHVRSVHPGSYRMGGPTDYEWQRVPVYGAGTGMRQAVLCYQPDRASQRRGIPRLAGVLKSLHQLGEYSDAELKAAVVSAFFTVFVKSTSGEDMPGSPMQGTTEDGGSSSRGEQVEMGPAAVIGLAPDEDITIANPSRPNANYAPFYDAILMQIGAALHIPLSLLQLRFGQSYSAAKAELLEAWRAFLADRAWIFRTYCTTAYSWHLAEFIARGWLEAPGFFSDPLARAAWCGLRYTGPAMGAINELDAVNAAKLRVQERFTSRGEESAAMTGTSWEARIPQMLHEDTLIQPVVSPTSVSVIEAPPRSDANATDPALPPVAA
jgi:lambda family phage portal protein